MAYLNIMRPAITTILRRTEPTQTFMSLTFPLPTSGNLLDRFDSFVYSVTKAVADQKDADPTSCIPDASSVSPKDRFNGRYKDVLSI